MVKLTPTYKDISKRHILINNIKIKIVIIKFLIYIVLPRWTQNKNSVRKLIRFLDCGLKIIL
jgi:hypothetical protein